MELELDIWPTFQDFYDLYDKKRGRPAAEKWWAKLTQKEKEACMSAIPAYIQANPDKQFRKDPERYLRHKAFLDEVIGTTTAVAPGATPTTGDYGYDAAHAIARRLAARRAQQGDGPQQHAGQPDDKPGS